MLVSVFTPIYWSAVLQSGAARNGFSLTQGLFRQESQLEFESGERQGSNVSSGSSSSTEGLRESAVSMVLVVR